MFSSWRALATLPSSLWVMAGATLVNRMGSMAVPLLALFATQGQGGSVDDAGRLVASYGLGSVLVAPVAGRMADTVGPLRLMRWSLVASAVLLVAFPSIPAGPASMVASFILAVVTEAYRPASLSIITSAAPEAQRRPALSLIRMATNLGLGLGPALGAWLSTRSFLAVFVVDAATSLLAAALLGLVKLDHAPAPPVPGAPVVEHAARISHLRLAVFLGATALIGSVFYQLSAALPLYMTGELGLPNTSFGLVFTATTLLIVATEVPISTHAQTFSTPHVMGLGAFLIALGFGLLAWAGGEPAVLLCSVVWTCGEMLLFPALSAFVADVAPPSRRGSWMGLYMMAFGVSLTAGPAAGTWVMGAYGTGAVWLCCLVAGSVAALAFLLVARVPASGQASG